MPYRSISELPPNVRAGLPDHALAVYREVFNEVWDEAAERGKARERTAHMVAWKTAVKRKYRKNDETGDREPVA